MKGIVDIADTVEFRTWAKGEGFTFDGLKDELHAALGEDEDPETVAQNVMDEIQSRQQLLRDSYPFECDGYKLRVRSGDASKSTYIFCLGLSLLPAIHIQNEQRCVQFETIAMTAARNFFGGEMLRIGAPWKTDDIQTYEDLLNRVVSLIPNLGVLLKKTAPDGGDSGWDVLLVKNFRDNRFPRFVALGNCATGRTDWKRKGRETEPDYFWSYFNHPPRSACVLFFAVPFAMDDDSRSRKTSPITVTFDRFRICENSPLSSDDARQWVESTRDAALEVPLN